MKVLPSGVYQYRFIVDGQWRYIPDMPWAQDDAGNAYNILDLKVDIVISLSRVMNSVIIFLFSVSCHLFLLLKNDWRKYLIEKEK